MDYDIIKKNLATYEEAKKTFSIIEKYENGEANHSTLYTLSLGEFG